MFDFHRVRPAAFSRFRKDTRGNIALLTGLLLLPLAGVGGLAIDHMQAASAKVRFDTAADAAALAAVNTAKSVSSGSAAWGSGDPIAAGVAAAARVFSANAKNAGQASTPEPQIILTRTGDEYVASVAWSTNAPATFGRLFGKESHPVSGRAEARSGAPLFNDFHIVMDYSASMLIGATSADIQRTYELTGCAFACHLKEDTLSAIRAQGGVRMRIDVMKDAVVLAIEELRRRSTMPNQYRFAVYGFSSDTRVFLDINDPRSSDYDAVIAAVRASDPWRSNGGGTNYPGLLSWLEPRVMPGGDGTSLRPLQRVILISDGMQNERRYSPDGLTEGVDPLQFVGPSTWIGVSRIGLMNSRDCEPIKAKGAEIAAVHVKYVSLTSAPVPAPDWLINEMAFIERNLIPRMPTTMGECASSPMLYADASTSSEIYAAIRGVFTTARKPTITR